MPVTAGKNFWRDLPKPFLALAPLANVTDAAFRRLIAKYSKVPGAVPYVTYTEFVSADGLALANEKGRAKLLRDLIFTEAERPIVAQFFTSTPAHLEQAAALAQTLGFDGVDINMGCPDNAVEKQGAGAKLILNPALAQELIAAAKRGAPNLPVSVKTRLGYHKDSLDEWLPVLLEAQPAAVIIHARTRKEMSKVPARWERVKRAVEIRNKLKSETLIVGNGDLRDVEDARTKCAASGADGAMLGRAVFGTPWLLSSASAESPSRSPSAEDGVGVLVRKIPPTPEFRLQILVEHAKLFEELLGDVKNFAIMKKHFKAYCEGFPGAKELRMKLMEADTAAEVEKIIKKSITDGRSSPTGRRTAMLHAPRPPGMEVVLHIANIREKEKMKAKLLARCISAVADIIESGEVLNEARLAKRLGYGYRRARDINFVWREHPQLWRIMREYQALMMEKHADAVRKRMFHRWTLPVTRAMMISAAEIIRLHGQKVSLRKLGKRLGVDHRRVWRYLRAKPDLMQQIDYHVGMRSRA